MKRQAQSVQPAKEMTRLWLIRHGEVEVSFQRVFGGRINMGLSARGHAQASALARFLEGIPIDAIYASPMRRVQETLAPLLQTNGWQPRLLEGLREVDFGCWTGLTWEQVRERHGISAFDWLHALDAGRIAEAETIPLFRQRVEGAVREILRTEAGRTVAVFCHGGVVRMALAALMGLELPRLAAFDFDYASASLVECGADRIEIRLLNYTPWRTHPGAE